MKCSAAASAASPASRIFLLERHRDVGGDAQALEQRAVAGPGLADGVHERGAVGQLAPVGRQHEARCPLADHQHPAQHLQTAGEIFAGRQAQRIDQHHHRARVARRGRLQRHLDLAVAQLQRRKKCRPVQQMAGHQVRDLEETAGVAAKIDDQARRCGRLAHEVGECLVDRRREVVEAHVGDATRQAAGRKFDKKGRQCRAEDLAPAARSALESGFALGPFAIQIAQRHQAAGLAVELPQEVAGDAVEAVGEVEGWHELALGSFDQIADRCAADALDDVARPQAGRGGRGFRADLADHHPVLQISHRQADVAFGKDRRHAPLDLGLVEHDEVREPELEEHGVEAAVAFLAALGGQHGGAVALADGLPVVAGESRIEVAFVDRVPDDVEIALGRRGRDAGGQTGQHDSRNPASHGYYPPAIWLMRSTMPSGVAVGPKAAATPFASISRSSLAVITEPPRITGILAPLSASS